MDYVKRITDLLRDVDEEITNYTDDYIPILSIDDDPYSGEGGEE